MVFCWIPFPTILPEDDDLGNQITYPVYSWTLDARDGAVIMRSLKVLDTETVIELGFDAPIVTA